jgi:cytosine/adenosine deaminase-related metal-dependent hydrolase
MEDGFGLMPSAIGPSGCDWFLRGARVALGPRRSEALDIAVARGRISGLHRPASGCAEQAGPVIPLAGCLVLPGLVNAHDHLEFSLFPRLGRGPFPNARQWALEVYRPSESPIREQLQIPKRERLIWGGLKSLLSGVTTVCHHNPYEPEIFENGFPVRVARRFGWAHSPDFSEDIPARFAATPPEEPFILHLGEATDDEGRRQVFELDAMAALDGRTVLVHGVALDQEGLALVELRGAAMVWCPSSNLFTLGATLDRTVFERKIRVALSTDSALTGEGDLLDELRVAQRIDRTGRARLYEMVTSEAAAVLRRHHGEGRLAEGGVADLIAIADPGCSPCEALTGDEPCEPLLVMVGGEVKLVAEEFAERLDSQQTRRLRRIKTAGRRACLVDADVLALIASARRVLGPEQPVRLAGKAIEE